MISWEEAVPRFTSPANAALDHAERAAWELDDNHVGTEHFVLGILANAKGAGALALAALGVTKSDFLAVLDVEPGPSPRGAVPLTPRANRILDLAVKHADTQQTDHRVGTGHFLL